MTENIIFDCDNTMGINGCDVDDGLALLYLLGKEPIARYIAEESSYWFNHMMSFFEMDGFYNWDVVAAAYLANPLLFQDSLYSIDLRPEDFGARSIGCDRLTRCESKRNQLAKNKISS